MDNFNIDDLSPEKLAQDYADSDPKAFEQILLYALLQDKELYEEAGEVICAGERGKTVSDFSVPAYNAVLGALRNIRRISQDSEELPDLMLIRGHLEKLALSEQIISVVDEVEPCVQLYAELASREKEQAEIDIATYAWRRWLEKRRVEQRFRQITVTEDWDIITVNEEVAKIQSAIGKGRSAKDAYYIGDYTKTEHLEDMRVLPTRIGKLDHALKGGIGTEEGVMFIGPSGAGKTVAACHIAREWATRGYKGLYVTTEQAPERLEPRMVSSTCRIPFDKISRGMRHYNMKPHEAEAYESFKKRVRNTLKIVHWNDEVQRNVLKDFHNEIEIARDDLDGLDFVILDWLDEDAANIGGANKYMDTRAIWKMAANHVAKAADKYKVATLVFVQATIAQAYNKIQVGQNCIAECKSMGQKFSTVIGITALRAKPDETGNSSGASNIFTERQYFYIDKARLGETMAVPFDRDYGYQRIKEV